MITVFTPAYNRGHLLHKVYESLCRQTFRDFEWVVVDDGSVDETASLFTSNDNDNVNDNSSIRLYTFSSKNENESGQTSDIIHQTSDFPIRYFFQENGGKHRAINHGVQEAQGELFLILDSDDTLPPRSLEVIHHYYQQIKDDKSFGGVCGYMAHHDGTIIGRGCDIPVLDANSLEMRYKYNIEGDMLEVYRTAVMREIPFPDIPGEKFVPEALVWNRIACKYRLRVFHEVVYYRDYLEGGLTDKIVKIRMTSPIASMYTYAELNGYDIPFVSKVKAAINYWRFRFCYNEGRRTKDENVRRKTKDERNPKLRWWWNWVMPLGYLMHLRDKKKYLK